MKKILIGLVCCFMSVGGWAKGSKITLESISKADDGSYVVKHYESIDVLNVSYSYGEDVIGDTSYDNILYLAFKEGAEDIIPVDIINTGFIVAGDLDITVRELGIKENPPENCNFEGIAAVKLNKMMLVIPEYPAGKHYSAKVKEVISSTLPKLVCE